MSTGINIAPSSGITVGTTPVTSGTNDRVFFQAGGVVQQDAGFLWDTTNKRMQLLGTGVIASPALNSVLEIKAKNGLSDIAFRIRNSADTQNLMSIAGNGDVAIGLNASGVTDAAAPFISIGLNAKATIRGVSIGANAGVNQDNGDRRNIYIGNGVAQIGTNQTADQNVGIGTNVLRSVTSGSLNVCIGNTTSSAAAGFSITQGNENVLIGNNAGSLISTGSGNTAVGRSAGTQNATGEYNTHVGAYVDQGTGVNKSYNVGLGMRMRSNHDGSIMIGSSGNVGSIASSIADDAAQFHFRSTSQSFFFNKNTNVVLKSNSALVSGTDFEAAATNTITIHNGTVPTTNIATAGQLYAESGALRYRDSAGTITNVGGSVQTVVSAATVTPVYTNKFVKITAQAAALTLANPTGTWAEGQDLMIRIKDDGTARAITWDTNYRAIGVTLPATTVISKTTYVGIIYNSTDGKWDVIGVTTEA